MFRVSTLPRKLPGPGVCCVWARRTVGTEGRWAQRFPYPARVRTTAATPPASALSCSSRVRPSPDCRRRTGKGAAERNVRIQVSPVAGGASKTKRCLWRMSPFFLIPLVAIILGLPSDILRSLHLGGRAPCPVGSSVTAVPSSALRLSLPGASLQLPSSPSDLATGTNSPPSPGQAHPRISERSLRPSRVHRRQQRAGFQEPGAN